MATQRRHGNKIQIKAYGGINPATHKPEYLYDSVPIDTGTRELDRRKRALEAKADELAAGRRARRKDPKAERPKKVRDSTVGEAVEVWWAKHGAKLASAPKVRTLVDSIILPELGAVPVALVAGTAPDDDDDRDPDLVYLSERWADIAARRGLRPSVIHRAHGMVGAALRRVGHPVPDPGLPPIEAREQTTPLVGEMAAFLAFLGDHGDDPSAMDVMLEAFALLVMSGPRPVEAAAVSRDMLDLDRRRLRLDGRGVVQRLAEDGSEVWVVAGGETVKRRKRVLTLDAGTAAALRRWLTVQGQYALVAGGRLSARSLVFSMAADASTTISPKVFSRAFTRAVRRAREAGLDLPVGFHLYDMRHFGISQLLRAGHDVTAVAQRFGTSARMIHSTYGHCIDLDDSRLADSLGAFHRPTGEVVNFSAVGASPSGG